MNKLQEKYADDIQKHLAKYPPDQKRSAVMPLLYIAQREGGYVSKHDIEDIAEICGITTSEVASIIGFYSLYHDKEEGKIRIQVCNDLPCALRGAVYSAPRPARTSPGTGSALRSTLPLGLSGNSSNSTNTEGTM